MQLQSAKPARLVMDGRRVAGVEAEMKCWHGREVVSPIVTQRGSGQEAGLPLRLTDRETEALSWAAAGKTAEEVGMLLKISKSAASVALASAARKMGCCTRPQAAYSALKRGLLCEDVAERVGRLPEPEVDASRQGRRGTQLPLTEMERVQLEWSSKGKTLWEVSRIVGVSEAYAAHLIQAAAEKMSARGKTHAVTKAAIWSLID